MNQSKMQKRVTACFGSINFNEYKTLDERTSFIKVFNIMFESIIRSHEAVKDYYLIFHTETETLHCHYLLTFSKQIRLSTIVNFLSNKLNVSPFAINIDVCNGLSLCLNYMLHKDSTSLMEGKQQYNISDIVSNLNDKDIELYINCDDDDILSIESLIRNVLIYKRKSDIMVSLGLKNYHKYRHEINDLLEDISYLMVRYDYLLENS